MNTSHIRYVHGVDFSGAEEAGKTIWIATGIIKGKTLGEKTWGQALTFDISKVVSSIKSWPRTNNRYQRLLMQYG